MKKVITSVATALLSLFALHGSAQSQASNTFTAPAPASPAASATIGSSATALGANPVKTAKEIKKDARETKQFNRITRRFADHFEDATNITWTKEKEGYTGSFTRDGMKNIVWYNNSGDITYLMVSYNEQRLPQPIKKLCNKAYKGFHITWVNEIHHEGNVIYLVTLENDSQIKQVTVCNGDMNIYRDYRKVSSN